MVSGHTLSSAPPAGATVGLGTAVAWLLVLGLGLGEEVGVCEVVVAKLSDVVVGSGEACPSARRAPGRNRRSMSA